MTKILLTGGAGYIGSVLIPYFLKQNYKVTAYDSLLYGGTSLLPYISNPNFSFIKGDVHNTNLLSKTITKNDIIIHLAAIVGLPACNKEPKLATETNTTGTKNVVDSLSKDRLLIFSSTVSNYGALTEEFCTEESSLKPQSQYARTKTEEEKIAINSHSAICLRFVTGFGVSPRMRLDLLINDFIFQAYLNRFLILFEKSYKRTFIHVKDIDESILFAVDNFPRMRNSIFNVGDNSNNYSKEEIALKIKQRFDYYLHFADIGKDEDKRNYSVSYDKINALGFKASRTVDEGIKELIKACQIFEFRHPYKNT